MIKCSFLFFPIEAGLAGNELQNMMGNDFPGFPSIGLGFSFRQR